MWAEKLELALATPVAWNQSEKQPWRQAARGGNANSVNMRSPFIFSSKANFAIMTTFPLLYFDPIDSILVS